LRKGILEKYLLCGKWRRPAAEEEGNHKNMKKSQGKVMVKAVLPKRYPAEPLEEQGKKDKGKELPPKPAELGPVLKQRAAVKQKFFRNQKPGLSRFGRGSAQNGGRPEIDFLYVPDEFSGDAEQHPGKQNGKEDTP
jgi:hypothetical protein